MVMGCVAGCGLGTARARAYCVVSGTTMGFLSSIGNCHREAMQVGQRLGSEGVALSQITHTRQSPASHPPVTHSERPFLGGARTCPCSLLIDVQSLGLHARFLIVTCGA